MQATIRAQLDALPATPGVYHFKNARGQIIYIGKAANLRSRVRSYFQEGAHHSPMKERMVGEIADITIIETDSEIEALLLEANHVKARMPHYNILLRDDKSYTYIKVSTEEPWPRVFATRRIDRAGTYFGPFTSGMAVKDVLRVLRKIVPFRCNLRPQAYRDRVSVRTEIRSPEFVPEAITASGRDPANGGRSKRPPKPCLQYHLGLCPGTCIGAITKEDYVKNIRIILSFLRGKKREVIRAVKKQLGSDRAAAVDNLLAHTKVLSVSEKYTDDARELQRTLLLPRLPLRVEGYDIANLMGNHATGAMVVFQNGEPAPNEYKKFKIKTVEGSNDVAMLTEVLGRRLAHSMSLRAKRSNPDGIAASPSAPRNDTKDAWPTPDLIIIDGGKAQLNAAVRALKQAALDIPVLSVAKGGHGGVLKQKEEIYFPGERAPLKLPRSSPALHLVLRVRDEAHRFAIGYHKHLRKKRFLGT